MSREVLVAAKCVAQRVLGPEWVLPLFQEYLSSRYGCPPDRVVFDYKDACRRIREAVYLGHTETTERADEINPRHVYLAVYLVCICFQVRNTQIHAYPNPSPSVSNI